METPPAEPTEAPEQVQNGAAGTESAPSQGDTHGAGEIGQNGTGDVPGANGTQPGDLPRGPDGKFLPRAGEAPPAEAAPPPPPKKWRLGETEFESPDELATAAERLRLEREEDRHYRQFVEQAAARERRAADLEKRLKADPWAALKEAGHDPKMLALLRVKQEMDEAKRFEGMTPEQIEHAQRTEQLEQELRQLKEEREQEKQKQNAEAVKLYTQARAQHYIGVINKALELTPELPKTGEIQARLVAELKRARKYKYDPPPEKLGRKVLEDLQAEHASWDTDDRFSAKDYVKRHPKRAEAIRAAVVESLQVPQAGVKAPAPTQNLTREQIPKREHRELLTPEEAEEIIRKRLNN